MSEFEIYHTITETPVKIKLQQEDEIFFVSVNDNFLGSMEIDLESETGFSTDDEELKGYIEGIAMHLRDETEKYIFAEKLMTRYGQNLLRYQFTNSDVLELISHPDTDIEDFGNVIMDLIYDDVTFQSKLSVVVSKENDDYTYNFDIN